MGSKKGERVDEKDCGKEPGRPWPEGIEIARVEETSSESEERDHLRTSAGLVLARSFAGLLFMLGGYWMYIGDIQRLDQVWLVVKVGTIGILGWVIGKRFFDSNQG